MKNLIIASTSTVHGGTYLDYLLPHLKALFAQADEVIFVPFARPGGISHEVYTERAANSLHSIGKSVRGLHTFTDQAKALQQAEAIFTGGGNTFLLVQQLHMLKLMQPLREAIYGGTPYLGTSAGSNICGVTMQTTNDMPIVYPASFKTLGAVPFNINPHYLDPDPKSNHMGETRETRIKEFHTQNNIPVVGLREGSWLRVKGDEITLLGDLSARLFRQHHEPYELASGQSLSRL